MQKDSLNIQQFIDKIESNMGRKKDLIVPTKKIMVRPSEIEIHNEGIFKPTEHCHRQIAAYTKIPVKYYERTMENPDLFAHNVNHWLGQQDEDRMIRLINGDENKARAFLSNRYRRIDNEHIAKAVIPVLSQNPHTIILTSNVTERKLYLMVAFANREGEVKAGDIVRAGIIITNSEIGQGTFSVLPYVHRLWCDNGAIADIGGKYGMKKVHIGRRIEGDENYIAYKDDTLKADDESLRLKMRDTVESISTGTMWNEILSGLQQAAKSEEIRRPEKARDELRKVVDITETEGEGFLKNLLTDGDLTRWGAGNAITRLANEADDYDRSVELQQIGGNVFNMDEKSWNRIAEAA